ncbi:MAG: hydrogenase formation protein HypD [Actinobacteria bacterium]|nr:hydrogenase formation protein HypD [Actinomycetota bacterium]
MQNNINSLIEEIRIISSDLPDINIMEVCGTHTMAIGRNGLRQLLPRNINLVSGPGCPVCVTPVSDIDNVIKLSGNRNNYIFTFGDMLKVPGSKSTLYKKRSEGANIKICYSPLDALDFAEKNHDINVIFIAIGFETTAPLTASLLKKAADIGTDNFYIYNTHKLVPPAIEFLLNANNKSKINAFLCPGHVCAVTGSKPYNFISEKFGKSAVVSGFQADDIVKSILMILRQIKNNHPAVEIQYDRVVKENGNPTALNFIKEVFNVGSAYWRGIGEIPGSGLELNNKFKNFDIKIKYDFRQIQVQEPKYCSCGLILQGEKKPFECKLFGKSCTPDKPVGPCMVSSEGTCAAYFKYEKYKI